MTEMASEDELKLRENGLSGVCRNGGDKESPSLDVISTTSLLDDDNSVIVEDSDDEWMRPAVYSKRQHCQKGYCCMAILTMMSLLFLVAVTISVGIVCSSVHSSIISPESILTSASILSAMNLSVDPCEDFYQYACGTWLDKVILPDGMSRWSSFGEVDLSNEHTLRKLLEKDNDNYKGETSTAVRKAIDYYTACTDREHIEELGIQPMLKYIEDIGGWSVLANDTTLGQWDESKWDLTDAISAAHQLLQNPFFTMWISTDDKDSNTNIIQFQQAGLGLIAPEMYADNNTHLKDAYVRLGADIATYLSLEGTESTKLSREDVFNAAKERMEAVLEIEVKMSKIFVPEDQLQDPVAVYHKMELKELAVSIPQIKLKRFLKKLIGQEVSQKGKVVVYTPTYFTKLSDVINTIPARDLADYVQWTRIKSMLPFLNQPIMEIILKFRKVMEGIDSQTPRWQKCVGRTQSVLGYATAALFIQEKVTGVVKTETKAMISNVREAFLNNLQDLDWMDKTTKKAAEEKAKAVVEMIGYPDWLENPAKLNEYYEKVSVDRSDSFSNYMNMIKFRFDKNIKKWKQPVDKTEWGMGPTEVNAYYNPAFNQIVFPTGILQYPFYDPTFPMSINYGAGGAVMGHELTHGFDNQGRKYNKEGNLNDWWLNETAQAYEKKAQCMVDQYSKYKVGDLNINGKLTLSENIADNSGLHIAIEAFELWKSTNSEDRHLPNIGLTPEQLFYVGFGRVWCNYQTPQSEKMSLYSDIHSNAKYRITGVLSNSKEFSDAFHCPTGSPMNPEKKCKLW